MKHIPLLDLKAQYHVIKSEIDAAITEVLERGSVILGPNVEALEKEIASLTGTRYAIGVANGSDALHLALVALGIGEGDEVIVPAFTFFATAGAVARTGATPVFVDIEPRTYNISPDLMEKAITSRTRAIIPVHLYGQPAALKEILAIARRHDLRIIEDAAQAIGAGYEGGKAGSFGDIGCFSFFPSKNLGAYGDGGMVVTNNDQFAEKLRLLRVHGSKPKYYHHILGYNSRLDEVQAAILRVKLRYLDKWTKARQDVARRYDDLFKERLKGDAVKTPAILPGNEHIFHQYTVRTRERDRLAGYLKEQGIDTAVYYPLPLHLQPVFSNLGYRPGSLPESEQASREVLSLPIYPELQVSEQAYVVDSVKRFFDDTGV